jgi:flagella basal body P-ring formation protein FlgA
MIRASLTFLIVTIFAGHAIAAMPRENSMVEGDMVRLGDVFDVTGPQADTMVGRAPLPGRREIYDVERLRAIARAYNVSWNPSGRFDRTVVERAGRPIEAQEIEQKILSAIGADPADLKIELANRSMRLYAALSSQESVSVRGVNQDARTGYFNATLAIATGDTSTSAVQVNGRIVRLTALPVLTRRILPGDVIKPGDVATIPIAANQVSAETVLDPQVLIGQTPRRPLREHQAILISDVRAPVLVAKGSAVTMVLEAPGLLLTAKGLAQDDGSKGETIRVTNTQSNRTIEAVVTAAGMARVMPSNTIVR